MLLISAIMALLFGFSPDDKSHQNLSAPRNGCDPQSWRENFVDARAFYGVDMPKKFRNLKGRRFGKLKVLSYAGIVKTHRSWNCVCDCGNKTLRIGSNLILGHVRSCGCLQNEILRKNRLTHGLSFCRDSKQARLARSAYGTWKGMRQRCCNPKLKSYNDYGGRGIKVCKRWNDFKKFLLDMGEKPSSGHTIDRINNNGNYTPSNCRWGTWSEQASNKRFKMYSALGLKKTFRQWSEYTGICLQTIRNRAANKAWKNDEVVSISIEPNGRRAKCSSKIS